VEVPQFRCGTQAAEQNLVTGLIRLFDFAGKVVEHVVELVVEFPQPIAQTQMASGLSVVELPLWNFHNSLGPLLRGP